MLTCVNTKSRPADDDGPPWVPISTDPPAVLLDGDIWHVCPLGGFECGRVPRAPFGEQWAGDVMAVHVALHHRHWPTRS